MKFGPLPTGEAEGAVLAHSVQIDGKKRLKKGSILTRDHITALREAGIEAIIVARMDENDIGEDEAAEKIAGRLSGPQVRADNAFTGRVNLFASCNGVFRANRSVIDAFNAISTDITLATLEDYSAVEAGRMVATVKIIPYGVRGDDLDAALATLSQLALDVRPYKAVKVGLVASELPQLKQSVMDKTVAVLKQRLAPSGSVLTREIRCSHEVTAVSQAIEQLMNGNDMLILFGASAISDIEDVLPSAIRLAGGTITRFGMPVDPGNLLLLGEINGKPIIGAPGCARSPADNGFDWVLARILSGEAVSSQSIGEMGVGGLLMEIASRPQPRERSVTDKPKVAAVILAAGQSRRMGKANKLLAELDGKPLVAHVGEAALGAGLPHVVAVTGHEAERVKSVLPFGIDTVENPIFLEGLSSSLKAGVASLSEDVTHALILLGDMPGITTGMIRSFVDGLTKAPANAIMIATQNGKRGNPVLWPRVYFEALKSIEGDTGARHLIEANRDAVVEIELGEAAHFDLDTPEALEAAGGKLKG